MDKPTEELRQHAAFRCRVLKPLDRDWKVLGDALHGMTRIIPQALSQVVRRLYIEYSGDVPEPVSMARKGERAGTECRTAQRTRAYQLMVEALPDTASSAVALGLAGVAFARFGYWNKHRSTTQLPTFKRGHPIVWAASGNPWSISRDEKGLVLDVVLAAGRGQRARIAIEPCGPGDWGHVRRLLDGGGSKLGELRLAFDERRRQWTAIMGYSWPKAPAADGTVVLALRRGIATFLTVVGSDGYATVLDDGVQLRGYKTQLSKRRGELNRFVRRAIGSGAHGHGKRRRLAVLEKLDNAERDWVDTRCKQLGARVVKLALARGARLVLLEKDTPRAGDKESKLLLGEKIAWFVERFPFYRLNMAVAGACARVGIETREQPTAYDATTCPACGAQEPELGAREKGRYECSICGYRDALDVASGFNKLIKAGQEGDVRAILQRRAKMMSEGRKQITRERQDAKREDQGRKLRGVRRGSKAAA